jgi:hypothetical protein
MREQLTQHFLPHSVPLQHTKAMTHRQWLMHVTNSSTTLLHIPMQAFGTRHATRYYQYTWTRHTFPLSKPGGKSRAAGHLYLLNYNDKDFNNGAILTLSTIIKHVMSSASEAELSALYYGCKLATPLWTTLEELGHVQPTSTPITTNNITAQGLTMGTMTPKASNLTDQRFHWLKCWHAQCQFQYL